jgi:hypothetical protein
MLRRNREIVIFNLSAIDLFCSGMGAVMVLMVLLMPYYRKQDPVPVVPAPPLVVIAPPAPPEPIPEPTLPKPVTPPAVLIHDLELMIVMDTTASMDDRIGDLRATLATIVNVLSRLSKNLKVGVVAYRDHGDEYVVRGFSLNHVKPDSEGMRALRRFIGGMKAGGGGDVPESVVEAMRASTLDSAGWTPLAELPEGSRQVILVVADAPGHDPRAHDAAPIVRLWQASDPRRGVYCAVPSSVAGYFTPLAEAGNGRMVAWTDMLGSILDVVIDRR